MTQSSNRRLHQCARCATPAPGGGVVEGRALSIRILCHCPHVPESCGDYFNCRSFRAGETLTITRGQPTGLVPVLRSGAARLLPELRHAAVFSTRCNLHGMASDACSLE